MKLYLCTFVLALAATSILINACMFHSSVKRATPVNLFQFK